MKKAKKYSVIRWVLIIAIGIFILFLVPHAFTVYRRGFSHRRGAEIIMREVAQLPYRMVYIAGVDDSLDMDGFVVNLHLRNGNIDSISFYDSRWAIAKHEIDFSIPGEYEVFLYWGEFPLGYMTIQVIAPAT